MNLYDIVAYLQNHKGSNVAFKGWNTLQLLQAIEEAIRNSTFLYAVDEKTGALDGIVVARADNKAKTMHVIGIVTSKRYVMRKFLDYFEKHYPHWKLTGNRNGTLVAYPKATKMLKFVTDKA